MLLAFAAWLAYAAVMNARFASFFRGRRAAWLAIGGLVLLLAVYGIVTAGHGHDPQAVDPSAAAAPAPATGGLG